MSVVTNGYQTTSPETSLVGTFAAIPPTGAWQTYTWEPLVDNSGNLIAFDPTKYNHNADGSMTLQYMSGGGYNANFFMFVPADNTLPTIAGTCILTAWCSLRKPTNWLLPLIPALVFRQQYYRVIKWCRCVL